MAGKEQIFSEGESPLEVEIRNLQDTVGHLEALGEAEVALGGSHTGIGNNVLSLVDIVRTRTKMLIGTINQMGWEPPKSKPQS